MVGELEAVMENDGGAPLFRSVGPFASVSDKDPGETPADTSSFLQQMWRNSSIVLDSSIMRLLRCHAASALLSPVVSHGHVLVNAHAHRHLLLLPSWVVGFLKSLMPQGHKFKLFTSERAVLQRKMFLASKYQSAPLNKSCP